MRPIDNKNENTQKITLNTPRIKNTETSIKKNYYSRRPAHAAKPANTAKLQPHCLYSSQSKN
jgi:hypothetical protein